MEEMAFMGKESSFETAKCIVVPLAYSSVGYTEGTLGAPSAILGAWRMEDFDLETGYSPAEEGVYVMPETEISSVSEVKEKAKQAVSSGKFPIFLGGDHSITIGTTAAYEDISVLIFDAHADLRDEYEGSRDSHACMTKRVGEMHPTLQIGIRSVGSEEIEEVKKHEAYNNAGPSEINKIIDKLGRNVYISIDVDVLDPSIMPATALPEPEGLVWSEILMMLKRTFKRRNVVGCDVCELSPVSGLEAPNALCAHLAYKLIAYKFASGNEK